MPENEPAVELEQVEHYRFEARYPGRPFGPIVVDESPPTGGGAGPSPSTLLATAVGHCMSSTLLNTLERAHVPVSPLRTTVEVETGRNDRGRLRVRHLTVALDVRPLDEADRPRFDHAVSIFEDFCTVSGAVREGVRIDTRVGAAAGSGPTGS
jgi:organic hydroperoxide reductase OsmC/OhrA